MEEHIKNPEPLISTIGKMFEIAGNNEITEILANAIVKISQTDYDNYDGGTYLYTIYLSVPIEIFSKHAKNQKEFEEKILEKAQTITRPFPNDHFVCVMIIPQVKNDDKWKIGKIPYSLDNLLADLISQRDQMIFVSTGGPSIKDVNQDYVERFERIERKAHEFGIEIKFPFKTLWDWYGRWRSGDLPTYQSRREFLSRLFNPFFEIVKNRIQGVLSKPLEPTGWAKVDRGIEKACFQLERAKDAEDFQSVGLLCREILISLAENVFKAEIHMHNEVDVEKISKTDSKRMLEAFITCSLKGSENENSRKFIRAAIDLANCLVHKRTAIFQEALMCLEATKSIVGFISIVSGRFKQK